MVCSISNENFRCFSNIIPIDILDKLNTEGYFFLGSVDGEGEGNSATGVMVFSLQGGTLLPDESGEEDTAAVAEIDWLYIDPKQSGKGYATELMNAFFDSLEIAGIDTVICDIPEGQDYDGLVQFLEYWGLEFDYIEKPILETTIDDLKSSQRVKKHLKNFVQDNNVKFLKEITSQQFDDVIELTFLSSSEEAPIGSEFTGEYTDYDEELSCVYLIGGEIKGAFLIRKHLSGTLEPVVLRSFLEGSPEISDTLLFAAINKCCNEYGSEIPILVDCLSEDSLNFVSGFFPNAVLPEYRRGIVLAYEEVDDVN